MPCRLSRSIICLLTLALVACARPGEPPAEAPPAGESAGSPPLPSLAPSATPFPTPTAVAFATPAPLPLTWEWLKNATYLLPEEDGGPADGQLPMEDGIFTWTPVPGRH